MKGGCWDAGALAEEVQAVLAAWLRGELSDRQALEAILEAARENNFPPEEPGEELPF